MGLPKALPGVVTEMIFHYKSPFSFVHSKTAECSNTAQSVIAGLRDVSHDLVTDGETGFIAVRFREGAFNNFCRVPQLEIAGQFLSPRDMWGHKGAELEKKVADSHTNLERVNVIESYLLSFLETHCKADTMMEYMVKQVGCGAVLHQVPGDMGISYRHFHRRFTAYTGLTPKTFQKISCFDSIMRNLTRLKNTNYLGEALNAGYFDQSHFIKDFKKYVNETPTTFLTEKNFMSHFYNTGDMLI